MSSLGREKSPGFLDNHERRPDFERAEEGGSGLESRAIWIDVARGFAIFLVVFEHVIRGLLSGGIISRTELFDITDYTIYIFHMPLFFFISGITIQLRIYKRREGLTLDRMIFIVYAYFLWSAVQLSLQMLFSKYSNYTASGGDFVRILYSPIGQFWFLYALFLCQLVFLASTGRRVGILLAIAAALGFRLSGIVAFPILFTAAYYFIYYGAGALAARQLLESRPSPLILPGFIGLFAVAAVLARQFSPRDFTSFESMPAAFLGIAAVIVGSKVIRGRVAAVFAVMGRLSLTIFVAHVIASGATRAVMLKLGVPHNAVLYTMCGVSVGILAPMLLHRVVAHFGLLPVFGLAPLNLFNRRREDRGPRKGGD